MKFYFINLCALFFSSVIVSFIVLLGFKTYESSTRIWSFASTYTVAAQFYASPSLLIYLYYSSTLWLKGEKRYWIYVSIGTVLATINGIALTSLFGSGHGIMFLFPTTGMLTATLHIIVLINLKRKAII